MVTNISTDELKELMDKGSSFVLINTLDHEAYEKRHICGSINMPVEEIGKEAKDKLGEDEQIVVYCSGPTCKASKIAADKLSELGFENVRRYEGGIKKWQEAGYCMEGTEVGKAA